MLRLEDEAPDERGLVARLDERDGAGRARAGGDDGRDELGRDWTLDGGDDGRDGAGRDFTRDGGDDGRVGAGRDSTRAGGADDLDGAGLGSTRSGRSARGSGRNGLEVRSLERTPSITRRGSE